MRSSRPIRDNWQYRRALFVCGTIKSGLLFLFCRRWRTVNCIVSPKLSFTSCAAVSLCECRSLSVVFSLPFHRVHTHLSPSLLMNGKWQTNCNANCHQVKTILNNFRLNQSRIQTIFFFFLLLGSIVFGLANFLIYLAPVTHEKEHTCRQKELRPENC